MSFFSPVEEGRLYFADFAATNYTTMSLSLRWYCSISFSGTPGMGTAIA